jgi:NADP-dependent 3-hydroxy acid dehydrogenase YdfG
VAAFDGKTAVVTGASSGIGRAIALRLGEAGAHVFAAGRRPGALADTVAGVAEAGGKATAVAADLRDPAAVEGLVDRAVADTGRLDVMVNNAAVSYGGAVTQGDPGAWREMLEINVLALAVGSRAAVAAMRACGAHGYIVNISSSSTRSETPGFYGATKTAVNAISASLRQELEGDTIRVVNVIPGLTATNLGRQRPELVSQLGTLLGEDITPGPDGLLPQAVLDRAAAAAGPILAAADDVARAVLFAITQPTDLNVLEIAVQPARRLTIPA